MTIDLSGAAASADGRPGQSLVIRSPSGSFERKVDLCGDRVTVGRFEALNDIALPDPYVSGVGHCLLTRAGTHWSLDDGGSSNGTFLVRRETMTPVAGTVRLEEGDTIRILGGYRTIGDQEEPLYWEMTYANPLATRRGGAGRDHPQLEFDPVTGAVRRIVGPAVEDLTRKVTGQPRQVLEHMFERNRRTDRQLVVCSHDELMVRSAGPPTSRRSSITCASGLSHTAAKGFRHAECNGKVQAPGCSLTRVEDQ